VRIPAALCGCYGFRPTIGRYPTTGIVPIAATRDTPGVMAMSIDDLIAVDNAIVAPSTSPSFPTDFKSISVACPRRFFWDNIDPEVAQVTEEFFQKMSNSGITLINANMDENLEKLNKSLSFNIVHYEKIRDLALHLYENNCPITVHDILKKSEDPTIIGTYSLESPTNKAYIQALQSREELKKIYGKCFAENHVDFIAVPTCLLPASSCNIGR